MLRVIVHLTCCPVGNTKNLSVSVAVCPIMFGISRLIEQRSTKMYFLQIKRLRERCFMLYSFLASENREYARAKLLNLRNENIVVAVTTLGFIFISLNDEFNACSQEQH